MTNLNFDQAELELIVNALDLSAPRGDSVTRAVYNKLNSYAVIDMIKQAEEAKTPSRWGCEVSKSLDAILPVLFRLGVSYGVETERILHLSPEPDPLTRVILDHHGFWELSLPQKKPGLRSQLRDHQEATDCDDNTMVSILCEFIEWADDNPDEAEDLPSQLIDFVFKRLEQGP